MRVLLSTHDAMLTRRAQRHLPRTGFALDVTTIGRDALWMAQATEYDAIVLDAWPPAVDGVAVCRRLRDERLPTPIVLLGRTCDMRECVDCLDAGADDYVRRPLQAEELAARLRALTRRGQLLRPVVLACEDLRLDLARQRVHRNGHELELSAKELALLAEFMRHPGLVLSRFHLLEHVWDDSYENRSNVVDVYVRYLREKVDRPFGLDSIETVRGAGYRFRETALRRAAARRLVVVA